jgi:hypothetical protein
VSVKPHFSKDTQLLVLANILIESVLELLHNRVQVKTTHNIARQIATTVRELQLVPCGMIVPSDVAPLAIFFMVETEEGLLKITFFASGYTCSLLAVDDPSYS